MDGHVLYYALTLGNATANIVAPKMKPFNIILVVAPRLKSLNFYIKKKKKTVDTLQAIYKLFIPLHARRNTHIQTKIRNSLCTVLANERNDFK